MAYLTDIILQQKSLYFGTLILCYKKMNSFSKTSIYYDYNGINKKFTKKFIIIFIFKTSFMTFKLYHE